MGSAQKGFAYEITPQSRGAPSLKFRLSLCTGCAMFLGAACGSPYIVFITRFRRMASGHGYIYRYIYNVDAVVV